MTKKYRWGGADAKDGKVPYFDETARRMLLTTRSSMLDVASELIYQGDTNPDSVAKREDYKKALEVADLMANNLPEVTAPYGLSIASALGQVYCELGEKKRLGDKKLTDRGLDVLWKLMERYAPYLAYNREMAMSFPAILRSQWSHAWCLTSSIISQACMSNSAATARRWMNS